MALRLRAAFTVWVTHRAVRLYTFVHKPFRPGRFINRGMVAIFMTILAYLLMTGLIAINGVGGIAVVWANFVVYECKQLGSDALIHCGAMMPFTLAGIGLGLWLMAGLLFALVDPEQTE
jgi:hypothetical protein